MGWPLVAVRPQDPIYAPSACVQFLLNRREDHERILDREVAGQWERTPFAFALPLLNRVDAVRGYNPLDIHRYKEYVQFISDRDGPVPPANGIGNFPIVNKTLLDLLGTRYLLQPTDLDRIDGEPSTIADDPRWNKIGEDRAPETHLFVSGELQRLPPYAIYENRAAFPRAFVVPRAEPLPPPAQVLSALKNAALRNVVYLEDFPGEPESTSSTAVFSPAKIVAYEPNRVLIEADVPAAGYLVLTDPWFPGWTCTVDGRPTPIYRADYVFRAVTLPAGRHQVHFAFEPGSLRRGKTITMVAMVTTLALTLAALVGRLRFRHGMPVFAIAPEPTRANQEVAR
jgi:hypothetical protein